jgi:hypothetical protein
MSTSAETLTWAWRQTPSKPLAKYVLVALAGETTRVQGGPYVADPGVAKLAKLTGLDESAVRRNLRVLVSDKIVTKERTWDSKGHRGDDRYVLPVAVVAAIPNGSRAQRAQNPVGAEPSGSRAQSQTGTEAAAESPVGLEPSGSRAQTSTLRTSTSSSSVVPSGAAKRGTRLPEDWWPTPEMAKWAVDELGVTAEFGRRETENFRDYWVAKPGKDGLKLDWGRTWKKWMRTEAERGDRGRRGQPRGDTAPTQRHSGTQGQLVLNPDTGDYEYTTRGTG